MVVRLKVSFVSWKWNFWKNNNSVPVEEYGQILDIDTDNTKPVSDSDVKAFLLKSKGIANPLIIQSLEKTRRNEMLISALSIGAGIRQISRLTGVSFGVIQKLQK